MYAVWFCLAQNEPTSLSSVEHQKPLRSSRVPCVLAEVGTAPALFRRLAAFVWKSGCRHRADLLFEDFRTQKVPAGLTLSETERPLDLRFQRDLSQRSRGRATSSVSSSCVLRVLVGWHRRRPVGRERGGHTRDHARLISAEAHGFCEGSWGSTRWPSGGRRSDPTSRASRHHGRCRSVRRDPLAPASISAAPS